MEDGARPFYEALKKVEFSPSTYKSLLSLYEAKLAASEDKIEEGILHQVACQWLNLNDEDDWREERRKITNDGQN